MAKCSAGLRDCINIFSPNKKPNGIPYSITNMGLSIELPPIAWAMDTYLAALDCGVEEIPNNRVGIYLKILSNHNQYARVQLEGRRTGILGRS
jgi:hypothetical protein